VDGNQRQVVANIVLASGAGLLLVGAVVLAAGTTIVGAALMLAGIGDLIAWHVLRRIPSR